MPTFRSYETQEYVFFLSPTGKLLFGPFHVLLHLYIALTVSLKGEKVVWMYDR